MINYSNIYKQSKNDCFFFLCIYLIGEIMNLIEIIIIAVSLAMDAFAVSICKGLSMQKIEFKNALIVSSYFGIFQALMPLFGYIFCYYIDGITRIDHFVSLILLSIIGLSMIHESFSNKEIDAQFDFKTMFILAIATSIDALAVGITFAFLSVNIFKSVILIGIITFILSFIGVLIGNKFGNKYGNIAELMGGIILILMGIKILFEHLGIF